jgi:hypothetical protein
VAWHNDRINPLGAPLVIDVPYRRNFLAVWHTSENSIPNSLPLLGFIGANWPI